MKKMSSLKKLNKMPKVKSAKNGVRKGFTPHVHTRRTGGRVAGA